MLKVLFLFPFRQNIGDFGSTHRVIESDYHLQLATKSQPAHILLVTTEYYVQGWTVIQND